MRLGVFLAMYDDVPFDDALDRVAALGVDDVEIGTGNYPGDGHCKPADLLADADALRTFRDEVTRRGLAISALSQHGNPLHPNTELAAIAHETWRSTVLLAEAIGVEVVNAFAGCPGDHRGAHHPNWVTCAWPTEYADVLRWQWDEVVLPYWSREARFAAEHGVTVGIEMHPGFVVYNPATLLRLRDECGPAIAANFDPSHLFWQGIDAVAAIRHLARHDAIVHVAAKDTYIDRREVAINGVLETRAATDVAERAWIFRTIGFGQGEQIWRDIVSALHTTGFAGTVSIEHEDRLLPADKGLAKAVKVLAAML